MSAENKRAGTSLAPICSLRVRRIFTRGPSARQHLAVESVRLHRASPVSVRTCDRLPSAPTMHQHENPQTKLRTVSRPIGAESGRSGEPACGRTRLLTRNPFGHIFLSLSMSRQWDQREGQASKSAKSKKGRIAPRPNPSAISLCGAAPDDAFASVTDGASYGLLASRLRPVRTERFAGMGHLCGDLSPAVGSPPQRGGVRQNRLRPDQWLR